MYEIAATTIYQDSGLNEVNVEVLGDGLVICHSGAVCWMRAS